MREIRFASASAIAIACCAVCVRCVCCVCVPANRLFVEDWELKTCFPLLSRHSAACVCVCEIMQIAFWWMKQLSDLTKAFYLSTVTKKL